MAERARKSLTYFGPWLRPDSLGIELGLSYPSEIEEGIERLREGLTHPQSEPGLTEIEFILRDFERGASRVLTAEGLDLDPDELWWEDDSMLGVKQSSAKAVLVGTRRLRESLDNSRPDQAIIEMMLLTAAAIRSELYEDAMLGISVERGMRKGGKASGKAGALKANSLHEQIVQRAQKLLKSGVPEHNLASTLAENIDLTPAWIRIILQKKGLLEKKKRK